jgi:hypothetical protein
MKGSGKDSIKALVYWIRETRSLVDPLAAFSSESARKVTVEWAILSLKQYLIIKGPSILFSENIPSKTCWMTSTSVIWPLAVDEEAKAVFSSS